MSSRSKRIVIVGGNFAGLTAARRLPRNFDVTVVDARDRFEWTPNIHEILSAIKTPAEVTFDLRRAVEGAGHRFVHDEVTHIDRDARCVQTAGGRSYDYDACLLAAGGARDAYGIPGVIEHSVGFRRAADAADISTRLARLARRRRGASVVIVGAGVSGIEALGEVLRRYRDTPSLAVHVVEIDERILAALPRALGNDVQARCENLNVEFHTSASIQRLDARSVLLRSGETIAADLTIWSAGMTLPVFLRDSGLQADDQPWLPVTESLASREDERIFVAGDAAGLPVPIRKQAYYAMDMGEIAGDNLRRFLTGQPLRRFRPAAMPMLIAFGDLTTYFIAGDTVVTSPFLAAAKEGIYQQRMAGLVPSDAPLVRAGGVAMRAKSALRNLLLPQLSPATAVAAFMGSRIITAHRDQTRE